MVYTDFTVYPRSMAVPLGSGSEEVSSLTGEVSTRDLRARLSDVLGRAGYAGERIGVTRNGKLAAVVIGVGDLAALETLEVAEDVAAYRRAKAEDDGTRVSAADLRADLLR